VEPESAQGGKAALGALPAVGAANPRRAASRPTGRTLAGGTGAQTGAHTPRDPMVDRNRRGL